MPAFATFAFAAALAQTSGLEAAKPLAGGVCVAGSWGIRRVPAEQAPDGTVRFYDREAPVRPDEFPSAAGADWYETGAPIEFEGRVYRKVGSPEPETWTLGRYNRFQAPFRGAPMMEPLGGEDRALLVLVEPIGCVFQRYETRPAAR